MAFDLDRFVQAQAPVWQQALAELRAGAKRSHWMWFVFPQLAALGRSATAKFYGLASREEARHYFEHPLLGPRLVRACEALLPHRAHDIEAILGPVDALKLRSCLTLFEAAVPAQPVFARLLDAFYDGRRDGSTLQLIAAV